MAPNDRRAKRRQQVRQEILDAAGELFAREGHAHLSMRRVAEKIDYSPGTIYLHFRDKADLLHQIADNTFERLIARLEAVTGDEGDPLQSLVTGCRAYIEFGLEHPHSYIVTFVNPPEAADGSPEIEFEGSTGQKAFSFLEDGIRKCIERGVCPPVDAPMTASYWWAAMHGLTSLLIGHKKFPWADREELIDGLLAALSRGLETAPRRTGSRAKHASRTRGPIA